MNTYALRTLTRVNWTIECPPNTLIRDVKLMSQKYIQPNEEVASLVHGAVQLQDDTEIGSHNIKGYIIARLKTRDPAPTPAENPKPIVTSSDQPSVAKRPHTPPPQPTPAPSPVTRGKYPPASPADLELALAVISDESKCKRMLELMEAEDKTMAKRVSAHLNIIKSTIEAKMRN